MRPRSSIFAGPSAVPDIKESRSVPRSRLIVAGSMSLVFVICCDICTDNSVQTSIAEPHHVYKRIFVLPHVVAGQALSHMCFVAL